MLARPLAPENYGAKRVTLAPPLAEGSMVGRYRFEFILSSLFYAH